MWRGENLLRYIYGFVKYKDAQIDLDFWQEGFIMNEDRFVILNKSRRTGFSFSTALKGLATALDPDVKGYTKQFVSYNEDDAIEKINFARQFYDSIPMQAKKKIVHSNATSIAFADVGGGSVSRLISTACRPPRGKGGDIALDEFAFYPVRLSELIYTAALPVISRNNGKVEIGSTPLGLIGKFAEIWNDRARYNKFTRMTVPWWFVRDLCVDVETAVREAGSMNTIERVMRFGSEIVRDLYASMDEDQFQQEYECRFVDEAVSYFPLELIHKNTPGHQGERESILHDEEEESRIEVVCFDTVDKAILNYKSDMGVLYGGYDVARVKDKSSLFLYHNHGGKKRAFVRVELSKMSIPDQVDLLRKAMKSLPIVRMCIDGTGLGIGVVDYLTKEFSDRIESVEFTNQMKEVLAMNLHHDFELRVWELPADQELHRQIHAIQKTPTSGGHFRFDGGRDIHGHQDSFWAMALARHAGESKRVNQHSRFYSGIKDDESEGKRPGYDYMKKARTAQSVLQAMIKGAGK